MATQALATATFQVGPRHKVTLTIPQPDGKQTCISAEWQPELPTYMSKQMLRDYRQGRNQLLEEVAKKLGGPILCVET